MQEIYPKFYKDFKCLMGDCPNTCCKGWGVDIDKDTLLRYKNINSPYGAKLKQILSNHKQFFKLGASCPFLNKEGLCDIEINLGESYLCDVCRRFPRLTFQYGALCENALSCACIEAARLLLSEKIEFETKETDKLITTYNTFDSKLFPHIKNCRNLIFKALQSNLNFDLKIQFVLEFGEYLQNNFRVYSKIDNIVESFDNKIENYSAKFTDTLNIKTIEKVIKKYMGLKMLTPNLKEKLDELLHLIYKKRITKKDFVELINNYRNIFEFNNILIYFIYKYFYRCVYDYKIFSRLQFAVYSTVVIMGLGVLDIFKNGYLSADFNAKNLEMFAREIEHNEDSIKKLNKFYNKKTR